MFKGLSGLKKAVKGGFSAVAEHSSQLAEQVVGDPTTSRDNLKQSIKKRVQGGVASVVDAGESVLGPDGGATRKKDKTTEVVHNIKHYGALGEDYLGYSDPTKDLRKAVRANEKKNKKARKQKEKKSGKKEDLFDPENIAKYKQQIEEKRLREQEAQQASAGENSDAKSESGDPETLDSVHTVQATSELNTPIQRSPTSEVTSPKSDQEDWKLFTHLTSGVDHLIEKTKLDLKGLKEESYSKRKEPPSGTQTGTSGAAPAEKKKQWVDLDRSSFDEFDGTLSENEGGTGRGAHANHAPDPEQSPNVPGTPSTELVKEEEEEEVPKRKALFRELSEEPAVDPDEDDDLFNTAFVDAVTNVKLVVIPDDPILEDGDDPFNTDFANAAVKKQEDVKKKEATKLKFSGLSSVADVLSGKADKVDKSLVDVTVKKKRRRANRINLIADDTNEITAVEDIGTHDINVRTDQGFDSLFDSSLPISGNEADLLATTPTPDLGATSQGANNLPSEKLDLSQFELFGNDSGKGSGLTSNVAILIGEFSQPIQEEKDDFDAAFDALAQESVTKTRLEELEKQFENDDIFDTSNADKVLKLASLIDPIHAKDSGEDINFEDPFDTSAFEHITGDVETELGFESLAQREVPIVVEVVPPPENAFESTLSSASEGWAVFGAKQKPPRPLPPKPRPVRAPFFTTNPLTEADAPGIVVKAPSTESIKSWNNSVAETLIKKSEDAVIAEVVSEEEEDPFDTEKFEAIVEKVQGDIEDPFDTKGYESVLKEEDPNAFDQDDEDPFDTSKFEGKHSDRSKEEDINRPQHHIEDEINSDNEEEEVPDVISLDLLTQTGDSTAPPLNSEQPLLAPIKSEPEPEVDPFDTNFAAQVLPDKGDPFDTSYVKHGPGKAELKALEEEFLTKEETSRQPKAKRSKSKLVPGIAGRARPKGSVKGKALPKVEAPQTEVEEDDPFDTTIADKLINTLAPVSVEEPDLDPKQSLENPQADLEASIKLPSPPRSTSTDLTVIAAEASDDSDFDPRG